MVAKAVKLVWVDSFYNSVYLKLGLIALVKEEKKTYLLHENDLF
jgi:hypothetical protein